MRRLETDPGGRTVTTVVAELGDGSTARFSADIVVVAAGAVNSAVVLLASANDRHPNGLANGSDVVGRHYMRHNNLALMAVSKEPNPTRFQKTLAVNDWYLGSDDFDYPLGGVQMLGKSDAEQIRANAPHWAGRRRPGDALRGARPPRRGLLAVRGGPPAARQPRHPRPRRRHPPGAGREEQHRRPQTAAPPTAAQARGSRACTRTICSTTASTCTRACRSAPPRTRQARSGSAPTPRARPSTCNCKAHELDNLYVVDTSFFPSIGAVNPSLTAIANALRVGDHLIERLG